MAEPTPVDVATLGESADESAERLGEASAARSTRAGAVLIGTGILASRVTGLVRQSVFAHFFGTSAASDAFTAAMRIPNFLQTLFGEGVLSASFIPVYAGLQARGEREEADRVAGAVLAITALVTAIVVVIGVLATPLLVGLIAGGLKGDTRALTITLVRILFPGVGMLVIAAWCLGVLNSHRRFLLSYMAPVMMNVAVIVVMLTFGRRRLSLDQLAIWTAWGVVIGSALQVAVQVPAVLRLAPGLRLALDRTSAHVRTVFRNFGPVFASRGVVQISGFIDLYIASRVAAGALASVSYAQTLYLLPISLFGMSVSAAELPAMSSETGSGGEVASKLRSRLQSGLQHIALFVIPSAVAFFAFGDVIVAALFQRGRFNAQDTQYVWAILAGSAIGLLAATQARLYASTYFALGDTKAPLRFAIVRVVLGTIAGIAFALWLPGALGIDRKWGAAGLTLAGGLVAWVEMALLRHELSKRIGTATLSFGFLAKLLLSAAFGTAVGVALKSVTGGGEPISRAAVVLVPFGVLYFALASVLRIGEASALFTRLAFRRAALARALALASIAIGILWLVYILVIRLS